MTKSRARDKSVVGQTSMIPLMLAGLAGLALVSLATGRSGLGFAGLLRGLAEPGSLERIILSEIRLPRTVLGPLIGFAFGLSGAALQGLLRNPLADPSVLGAPQMAALGAAGGIFMGGLSSLSFALPLLAIGGALVSVAGIALVAGRHASTATVLIAGLALSSLAAAGLSFLLALSSNPFALAEIVYWLMGSLEDRSWEHVLIGAPPMVLGAGLLLSARSGLGALALGEEVAASLGLEITRLRWRIACGTALAVGGAVAVAGAIGFVGLIAPHLVRGLVAQDAGRTVLPAGLAGALLVLGADMVARMIPSTSEIKVGMVTALIGVPVFLVLLIRHRARFGDGG